jgi:hypothetical protein
LAVSPICIDPFLKESIAMTTLRILSIALIASSLAMTAGAQQRPADSASSPMAAAMQDDCAKPMARHDHGAEKGTPTPRAKSKPCAPAATASASKAKP